MAGPFRLAALFAISLTCAATARAQLVQPASRSVDAPADAITLGPSAVPLYGPWKFTVGDSPIDPATNQPLSAQQDFDDSKWETVDLTPKNADVNPTSGIKGYVPGWGARGHPGTSGYGWYRVRVKLHPPPGETLSLAGPAAFDDAYQVFLNGRLLGGFGFYGKEPQVYYAQPVAFPLGPARDSEQRERNAPVSGQQDVTQVIAFRSGRLP